MKNSIIYIVAVFISSFAFSQQGDGGMERVLALEEFTQIEAPVVAFSRPDIKKLQSEDKLNDSLDIGPWRFGYNYSTDINLENSGTWTALPNYGKVWQLRISAEEAISINLTFSNTKIPEGNELFIYNPEKSFILGKFTQKHLYKGELGAELIAGNEVEVAYFVPFKNAQAIGSVEITTVTYGYRSANEMKEKVFGSSGGCNMNVNCPDGAPYSEQRDATLMLVVGSNGFCTGSLINNTNYDGKPYVLTANHCYNYNSNITSWIFRFNWQGNGCDNPATEPSFLSLSGATLLARRSPTDFCLVEIMGGLENDIVPENFQPYYAGWDRRNEAPSATLSIHHPAGDIKKISFDDNPPVAVQAMSSPEANSSWKVIWDRNTVTEGGSSGSPLFNNIGLIIGQLWGGNSHCSNAGTDNAYDYYGRIHNSWSPDGSDYSNQLKYWLDPDELGNDWVLGHDPYHTSSMNDAAVIEIQGYQDNGCANSFYPKVTVFNKGTENLTSLVINYDYNGNSGTYNWTGNLATYEMEEVELPLFNYISGNNTIDISVELPNGETDEESSNNITTTSFPANPGGVQVDLELFLSCWPEENSWVLTNENEEVLYSGGNYPSGGNINFLVTEQFCLPNGCYTFTLNDSYGDGINGSGYNTCDYDGSMTITLNSSEEILAQMTEEESGFGSSISFDFCITTAGLTDFSIEDNVSVYPNPSQGEFKVEMNFEGEKKVKLMSLNGQIIANYKVFGKVLNVREQGLAEGMYFVIVESGGDKIVRKVVVR